MQKALINMLDDFNSEKECLLETQKALLTILDDLTRILSPNEVEIVTKSQPGPTGAHAREFFAAAVSRSIDGIRLLPDPGSQRRVTASRMNRLLQNLLDVTCKWILEYESAGRPPFY